MGELQEIEKFINTQSALRFSGIVIDEMMQDKKSLYDCYAKNDSEPLDVVIDRLIISCLDRYQLHIEAYKGWIENGRVFVINKVDKIVFFLAGNKDDVAWLIPHYNPNKVDVIEQKTSSTEIFRNPERDIWDFSKDDSVLITELKELIKNNQS